MTKPPALELRQINASFTTGRTQRRVLNNVNLTVQAGEIVALLGASGSGKTTLLRIVAGMLTPDSGNVILAGREATQAPPEKRQLGYVFQDYALWPHLSALQHLTLLGTATAPAQALLERVGLAQHAQAKPDQLSGGQRQRVALARALCHQPTLVLLDEPYSALDPVLRETLRSEVATLLREQGQAALHVTHDPDEALSIADRVVILGEGRVIDDGSPADVYLHPSSLGSAQALGRLNQLPARLIDAALSGVVAFRWEHAVPHAGSGPLVVGVLERPLILRGSDLAHYRVGLQQIIAPQGGTVGDTVPLGLAHYRHFPDAHLNGG